MLALASAITMVHGCAETLDEIDESLVARPWVHTFTPLRELLVTPNGTGGMIQDFVGTGDGTIMGTPAVVAGKVQSPAQSFALNFDGIDDHVELSSSVLPWGASGAFSVWLKSGVQANEPAIIGSFGGVSSGGVGQMLTVQNDGKVKVRISENAATGCEDETVTAVGPVISNNQWHHVAVSIDQTANVVSLYVDGQLAASASIAAIDDVGCGIQAVTKLASGFNAYYKGSIDELAIYNRTLSAQEVTAHYNGGQGKYLQPVTGMVAGYHLDEDIPGSEQNPLGLAAAFRNARAGDLYWLAGGNYNGTFTSTSDGTPTNPIVYRAKPGARVRLTGAIDVRGDETWVWGLEITDPNGTSSISGITLNARGGHAINNVVHHTRGGNLFAAWNVGPRQVVYGNVAYGDIGAHRLYTQNDFDLYGYKYIVQNVFMDGIGSDKCYSPDPTNPFNCSNLHAYAEGNAVTGFHVENNIFDTGSFLIGGFGVPTQDNVIIRNYLYSTGMQLGYRRPAQAEIKSNYLVASTIDHRYFWGAGEVQYPQHKPNVCTNNEIHLPPSGRPHIQFRTSAYTSIGIRQDGVPKIQATDTFNNNKYSGTFSASFFADNKNLGNLAFDPWKAATQAAGNAFDTASQIVPVPTTNKIVVIPNEYESGRGHIAVYNHQNSSSVSVNLSSFVAPGASYKITKARDPFGPPVKSGVYAGGAISIPVSGPFNAFVVTSASGSGGSVLWLQAESVQLVAPMAAFTESDGTKAIKSTVANAGVAHFQVNIPHSGTYLVWARVKAPTANEDSFFVSVDGANEDVFDVAEGTWSPNYQNTKLNGRMPGGVPRSTNPRLLTLTAGTHTISFRGREANAALDWIIVTDDLAYVP